MIKFKFLSHVADKKVEAFGHTLEEAFENAALATFEVMTDTSKIEPKNKDVFEIEGHDNFSLLYNWLEELLRRFDMTMNVYSRFHISQIKKTPESFKLKARIRGERLDFEKHTLRTEIKAVTYHQMEILEKPKKVIVRFILDI